MRSQALKGHLDMLLLAVLRAGAGHGYAIIQRLAEASGGAFDLPEGTIYPALHRLEQSGWLASDWSDEQGRKRRVYALTDGGAAALAAERDEWRRFAAGIQAVLGWPA